MDDIEDINENIAITLMTPDQNIYYNIIVKKYFTCSQLIFYINQVIQDKYKGYSDIADLFYAYNGKVLAFSSATIESLKITDGTIIMIFKSEPEKDDSKNINIKKLDGSINIIALSREEEIDIPMKVDINMASFELIMLINLK